MWKYIAGKILRNRLFFVALLLGGTVLMGYFGSGIQLSYEFARILPAGDPDLVRYEKFKERFGHDGNVMVIGFRSDKMFEAANYNAWYRLNRDLKKLSGIQEALSISNFYKPVPDSETQTMQLMPLPGKELPGQQLVDSIRTEIMNAPFYNGLLINQDSSVTLMAITFSQKELNSKERITLVKEIKARGDAFSSETGIPVHYSGMPYIRTAVMEKVSHEMQLFMLLAVILMSAILFAFFKSVRVVFFSVLVVAIGVVWSLGTIVLLNYKITILSGLIPPLIMVIGIPNCVFLINKYHSEFIRHGNRMKALSRMIQTMGLTLFLANITTAIGFAVLYFTNSSLLTEFGVISAVNIMITFLITLILIPIILSWLPLPGRRHVRHLDARRMNKVLRFIDYLVHEKRRLIYVSISTLTLLAIFGMMRINVEGFVIDDLPKGDVVYRDLKFFESGFRGILPFEVMIDSKKPNGIFAESGEALYKMNRFQKMMETYPCFSKPLSLTEGVKVANQAIHGHHPKHYRLPGATGLRELSRFQFSKNNGLFSSTTFIDSTKSIARISFQMADIGSVRTKELVAELKGRTDSIFNPKDFDVTFTGHSLIFLKGNDYLLRNLLESLLIEIILITLVGLALFRSVRIILLSKLPCLIPLIITAGIMGFLDIRFKPSTILIFSIAFGISSDGTIYFLTRYRHELKNAMNTVSDAISITIRETGLGMIYTAVILFAGFSIFSVSDFGGTAAMGILISITLLMAMLTNLVLLPAILLSIDAYVSRKEMVQEPLIDLEESVEEEVE